MTDRNKATPAVYIILEKDDKILIARRCNTGYEDGNYQVPAGHVDEGELPTEAMVREAKEEIGIKINSQDLELVHTMYRTKHNETGDRLDLFFKAHTWSGEVSNTEPHKCDDLCWVEPDKLPNNFTPHVRYAIECVFKGVKYSEIDVEFSKLHGRYNIMNSDFTNY
jgi:mutator protein MutT